MPPDGETVRLALDATAVAPAVLDDLHLLLGRAWEHCPGVAAPDRTAVELAVAEIAANIVEHTRAAGHELELVAVVTVRAGEVAVALRDTGRPVPVDLAGVSLPDPMAERGRGLAMAQMVADVAYAREDACNHWRIVRRRT